MSPQRQQRGFTLIEILCVTAIMALMVSISLPAIGALTKQAGRKGAVNQLLIAIEQTRVAALEQGVSTYLVFADNDFYAAGLKDYAYRAYVVMRDPNEDEPDGALIPLTKWQFLPKGVALSTMTNTLFDPKAEAADEVTGLPNRILSSARLPYIKFNPAGVISYPSSSNNNYLKFLLYEGQYDGTGDSIKQSSNYASNIYDTFWLIRYTGRVLLETESVNEFIAAAK